jgi:hypothetical protein
MSRGKPLPPELGMELGKLRSKHAAGVVVDCVVDASEALGSIYKALQVDQSSLGRPEARKVFSRLRMWCSFKGSARPGKIVFSDGSIARLSEILVLLFRLDRQRGAALSKGAVRPKLNVQMGDLFEGLCRRSGSVVAWVQFGRLLEAISSFPPARETAAQIGVVRDSLLKLVVPSMEAGETEDLNRIRDFATGDPAFREEVLDEVRTTIRTRASTLPPASQEWAAKALAVPGKAPAMVFASPSESPDIRHAAALLLFLWDQSNSGPSQLEALQRFQSLCQRHFHLFLMGEVGSVVEFRPGFHDAAGTSPNQVRIVRPGVELVDPPNSAVVIRAMAEAISS